MNKCSKICVRAELDNLLFRILTYTVKETFKMAVRLLGGNSRPAPLPAPLYAVSSALGFG